LRAAENLKFLLSIEYIEVFYPNPILKNLNLIDTPGLASFYEDDSKNTLEFLKLYGAEITAKTQKQASNADAILYLFRQSASTSDEEVMKEFQGSSVGRASPINAIGVLTRTDDYWPSEPEPMATGRKIAQRLMNDHPQLRCLFYTIQPVCGLLALGAQTLTAEEWEILSRLATLDEKRLKGLLRSAERFCNKDYPEEPNIPSTVERNKVYKRLGLYGIDLACSYIHSKETCDRHQLAQKLLEKSGVDQLIQLILSHFGSRAFLIKLNTCLQTLKKLLFDEERKQTGAEQNIIREIIRWLDKLESDELFFHQLRELEILRGYYEKKLNFTDEEVEQLLQVVGEKGSSCAPRLGLPDGVTVPQMCSRARERLQYWLERYNDAGNSTEFLKAANVLVQSYERLAYQIGKTQDAIAQLNFNQNGLDNAQLLANRLEQYRIPELLTLGERLKNAIATLTNYRQFLTEYETILQQSKKICFLQQQKQFNTQIEEIVNTIDKIEANEHALRELKVLRAYEEGRLNFSADEAQQLLEVMGEKGTSCGERLGLSKEAEIDQMRDRAQDRKNYWLVRANDPFSTNSHTRLAAEVLVQSYERLRYYLEEASQHLDLYNKAKLPHLDAFSR
jgi:hypothetical protein